MDSETAREKLNSIGYVHCQDVKSNRDKRYKTFSDTDTSSKTSIDNFKSTSVGKNYSSVSPAELEKCPFCKAQTVFVCPCGYSDKECSNKHTWYYDREGVLKRGKPH